MPALRCGPGRVSAKRIAVGAALVLAMPCALLLAFVLRFSPRIPPPRLPAPVDAAEANRQDLRYLRDTFPSIDRSLPPDLLPGRILRKLPLPACTTRYQESKDIDATAAFISSTAPRRSPAPG